MATVILAFYKGTEHWMDRAIQDVTEGPYSHCELVVHGIAYSSSTRDNGVRQKDDIDFYSGHWDLVRIEADEEAIKEWFAKHDGAPYDYLALSSFIVPWRLQWPGAWFCSEACAAALLMRCDELLHPNALYVEIFEHKRFKAQRIGT